MGSNLAFLAKSSTWLRFFHGIRTPFVSPCLKPDAWLSPMKRLSRAGLGPKSRPPSRIAASSTSKPRFSEFAVMILLFLTYLNRGTCRINTDVSPPSKKLWIIEVGNKRRTITYHTSSEENRSLSRVSRILVRDAVHNACEWFCSTFRFYMDRVLLLIPQKKISWFRDCIHILH